MHAATAIGYTASYDAAGNMTCRAASSPSTCTGASANGAQLTYDTQGQTAAWQNVPTSPNSTATFLYDGAGQRVAQQTTQGGITTTTAYVGDIEEVATSGGSTTTTTYYYALGKRIAVGVNGSISYVTGDALGSASVALSSTGGAIAAALYAPYGGTRYSNGSMPGSFAFTGQRADAVTGLDYFRARYYDPVAGQFTSADTILQGSGMDILGLSRFAYVEGNPVARTDPTGHFGYPGSGQDLSGGYHGPWGYGGGGGYGVGEGCGRYGDRCGGGGGGGSGGGGRSSDAAAAARAAAEAAEAAAAAAAAAAAERARVHRQEVMGLTQASGGGINFGSVLKGLDDRQTAKLLGVLVGGGIAVGGCLALGAETLGAGCVAAVYVGATVGMAVGGMATGESSQNAVADSLGLASGRNQRENARAKAAADKAGLNEKGADYLHRQISGQKLSQTEIEEIAQDTHANFPKFRR